jgi:hypothetical protein
MLLSDYHAFTLSHSAPPRLRVGPDFHHTFDGADFSLIVGVKVTELRAVDRPFVKVLGQSVELGTDSFQVALSIAPLLRGIGV